MAKSGDSGWTVWASEERKDERRMNCVENERRRFFINDFLENERNGMGWNGGRDLVLSIESNCIFEYF